jgi:hypothetical protein
VSGAAGRSAEVLRAQGRVGVEVGAAGHVWLSHISHIYKDACGLAQAKGLPSLIYHEPAIEVKFMRGAAGTTRILTIRGPLIAAFASFVVLFEQAMHAADRAEILAFIEQRRINSGRRAVLESFFVKTCQDRFSFCPIKGPRRRRPRGRRYDRGRSLTALPVVGRPRHPQNLTSLAGAHVAGQFADRGHQDFSSGSTSGSRLPNSAATFF